MENIQPNDASGVFTDRFHAFYNELRYFQIFVLDFSDFSNLMPHLSDSLIKLCVK